MSSTMSTQNANNTEATAPADKSAERKQCCQRCNGWGMTNVGGNVPYVCADCNGTGLAKEQTPRGYKSWECPKCGHEVLSVDKPQPIKWTDGHVCYFAEVRRLPDACEHLNNQCKGDHVVCNDCGDSWLVEQEEA